MNDDKDLFGLPARAAASIRRFRKRHAPEPGAVDIVSYGGGVQSAAVAALILRGELRRPERLVMMNTGKEASAVWRYLDTYVNRSLSEIGLEVEVVPSADWRTVGLIGGKEGETLLTPAYTTQREPVRGKYPPLGHFCSVEWKRRPFRRYLRSLGYGPTAEGRTPVNAWLGFSTDEIERAEPSDVKWVHHSFPLLRQRPTARAECPATVAAVGWPQPPKSACKMCALRNDAEWRAMRDSDADEDRQDWHDAVAFDAMMRTGGLGAPADPDKLLHPTGVPLGEADIDAPEDLFSERTTCNSGHCFV